MISVEGTQSCREVRKSQTIRLLDVFVYGPFMVYCATTPKLSKSAKLSLLALGISTVIYNGKNYIQTKE